MLNLPFRFFFMAALFTGQLCLCPADTLGYWQFDEADAGTVASVLESAANNTSLIATASSHDGGMAPQYSSDVPGHIIREGEKGLVFNANNTTSLSFSGGSKNMGGIVAIRTEVGKEALLQPRNFTIEAFVKTEKNRLFGMWFVKNLAPHAMSWGVGPSFAAGKIDLRADNMGNEFHAYRKSGLDSGAAKNNSLLWHHVALTYDESTKTFSFYDNYVIVGSLQLPAEARLQYDEGELTIGDASYPEEGAAFTGLIDEVRLSDRVLATDDFLRADP